MNKKHILITSSIIISLLIILTTGATGLNSIDSTYNSGDTLEIPWFNDLKSKIKNIYGNDTGIGINTAADPNYSLKVSGKIWGSGLCLENKISPQLMIKGILNGTALSINIGTSQGLTNIVAGAKVNDSGTGFEYLGQRGASMITLGDGDISFSAGGIYSSGRTPGTPVNFNTAMYISSNNNNGNIGIGTTTPVGVLHIAKDLDAGSNSAGDGASLVIGDINGVHTEFDSNEINAMNGNQASDLFLNFDGGNTIIGNYGNLGIGTINPTYRLTVAGDGYFDGWLRTTGDRGWFNQTYGGGWNMTDTERLRAYANKGIYTQGTMLAGAFIYYSDKNLKINIKNLDNTKNILKISPKRFDWKNKNNKKNPVGDIGVIAQDVEKYFPEFVETNEKGIKSVNYPKLVVPLIGVVKEQQSQIENLEKKVSQLDVLKKEIEELKNVINKK